MKIDERVKVPVDPDTVWALLSDPRAVVECVEGATLGDLQDDGYYDAKLTVRFGPAKVGFGARVAIEMDDQNRTGKLSSRGKDNQGGTRFSASTAFQVVADEAAPGTLILIQSEVEISGRLASLIESGTALVVKRMTKDFSERLTVRCTGAAGAQAGQSTLSTD